MIVFHFIYFLLLCLFAFYLPGRFLLRKVKCTFESPVIHVSVSIGVGVSLFLFCTYLLAWINLSFLFTIVLIPIFVLEIRPAIKDLRKYFRKKTFFTFETFLIVLGTFAMTYLTWRSGSIEDGKLVFFGVHAVDSIYHQSLIGNLVHSFPPTHPGIAGVPLRGYNFFYDFLTVQFAKLYFLDRFDLFFRFMPLFTSFLYGLSGLALARYFGFNRLATLTTIYLLYFAQNFSFFFRLFPNNFAANFNFEIIQSFGNIHDPSIVFSSILMFLSIITLFSVKGFRQWIIPALLLGVIPTMKIHTGVIAFAPLGIIAIISFLKSRDIRFFGILLTAGIIAAITYLPINLGAGHLIFYPFLLYRHYMDSAPMFKNAHWSVQYQIFQQHSNYLRMGFINGVVMICYLIPNLGIRLVSLLLLPKLFKRSYWTYPKAYLFIAMVVGFLVPTLFIQSVYAFVIIQFLWMTSILLVFPTSVVLATFLKRKSNVTYGIYIIILLALTLPATIVELYHHSENPYEVRDDVYAITQDISQIAEETESIFVVNRFDGSGIYSVPLVSALSGRSVYSEPEVLEFAGTADEIALRTKLVDDVSQKLKDCNDPERISRELKEILFNTSSKYFLVLIDESCMEKVDGFTRIKGYDTAALYTND